MVKLIVAIGSNRVIGKDNDLIWHLPADMKFFSDTTKGHVVIMGRRNWHSIPDKYRPLPNRENVVVSRDPNFTDQGCTTFTSVEAAIEAYKADERDTYIIGGGQIYWYALDNDLVDEMLITHIEQSFEGDTFFPEVDMNNWTRQIYMTHEIDEKNPYAFKVWEYKKR